MFITHTYTHTNTHTHIYIYIYIYILLLLLLPKIEFIHLCTKFGEDISFHSRVIAFFVKLARDFRTFCRPIATVSQNLNQLIFTVQRIFLQWFGSDREFYKMRHPIPNGFQKKKKN